MHAKDVLCVKYLEEFQLLASSSRDSTIKLYDMRSNTIVRTFIDEYETSIWKIEYLKNFNQLASCGSK